MQKPMHADPPPEDPSKHRPLSAQVKYF